MNLTSTKPYLARATYEWLVDNNLTPQILVDAKVNGAESCIDIAKDGKVVFNISMSATRNLEIGNEIVTFNARFNGRSRNIDFPTSAMLAIFAQENQIGITFNPSEVTDDKKQNDPPAEIKRPKLSIVK